MFHQHHCYAACAPSLKKQERKCFQMGSAAWFKGSSGSSSGGEQSESSGREKKRKKREKTLSKLNGVFFSFSMFPSPPPSFWDRVLLYQFIFCFVVVHHILPVVVCPVGGDLEATLNSGFKEPKQKWMKTKEKCNVPEQETLHFHSGIFSRPVSRRISDVSIKLQQV